MSSMEAWCKLWYRKLNPCDSVHLLYPIPRYWNEKRWKDIRYLLMWSCLREFFILKFGVQKGNMNAYVVFLDENCARSAANSCNGMNLTITYNRKIMITYPQGCFTRFRNWWRATKNPPKVKLCNSLRHCDGCKLSQRPLYILGYVATRYILVLISIRKCTIRKREWRFYQEHLAHCHNLVWRILQIALPFLWRYRECTASPRQDDGIRWQRLDRWESF